MSVTMAADDWELVETIGPKNLRLVLPWHFLCEIVDSYTMLYLKAEGVWDCLGSAIKPCGADGHAGLYLPDSRLTLTSSAAGALIGKFGGSTAGRGETTAFSIGSHCFVAMTDKRPAALFIAVNGAVLDATPTLTDFKLEIYGAGDP
jgi:hypothetical protein